MLHTVKKRLFVHLCDLYATKKKFTYKEHSAAQTAHSWMSLSGYQLPELRLCLPPRPQTSHYTVTPRRQLTAAPCSPHPVSSFAKKQKKKENSSLKNVKENKLESVCECHRFFVCKCEICSLFCLKLLHASLGVGTLSGRNM